ncbi:hypothetical protein A628_04313 [Salmonella enterica subsp. enterica serovar Cubana str. 76814]|uniref:Uncharacterized protein n=1 Tax=Salmonella enterica subsp. enterica serovar Cubana str. 76814 TaxID=1192560 RepID=V7IIE3_SALET|nr:hypothetical protein A628_04313 [Salmonella enterica subsp. enterica serovar Cubana str. 76814]
MGGTQRNIRYPVPQAGSGTTLPTVFVTRFPDKCLFIDFNGKNLI